MANMTRKQVEEFLKTRDKSKHTSHHLNYLGDLDLSGLDLSGLDLSHLDVQFTNFSHANMQGVDLSNSFICGTSFYHANLVAATMSNARVRMANFTFAKLVRANLSGLYLDGAQATADYSFADLRNCNFTGAQLSGIFCFANLTKAQFDRANLAGSNFVTALLNTTSFAEVDLRGLSLKGELDIPFDKHKYPLPDWCVKTEDGFSIQTVVQDLFLQGALWDSETFGK